MIDRNVKLINIAKIDLLKGRVDSDLDSLSKILLDNYHNRFECEIESTYSEDSICPPNDIVDDIIEQMKMDFKAATGESISPLNYWGHIHEKNMSTNMHNHNTTYVSSVVYVEVPEGSGSIVFRPRLNQYDNSAYSSRFAPERGVYYIFPGYLDHFVTRNMSNELRISLSINFKKGEEV
tara:strand:- start:430 stop:966 length:537 start_codon:yes stop_codon:yes gene_type:complete